MIYFIQDEQTLAIKIGYTSSEGESRVKALQTGNSSKLILLGEMPGEQEDERNLHREFASYRIAGEWFHPAPRLIRLITNLNRPAQRRHKNGVETVYLAGKMRYRCWRDSIVETDFPIQDLPDSSGLGVDTFDPELPSKWPILENALFGKHHYSGPFFISTGHDFLFCGDDRHGSIGRSCVCDKEVNDKRSQVVRLCEQAIRQSTVLFAWIDSPDCYGTIAEIGYAKSLGLTILVAGPHRQYRDLWFAYYMANRVDTSFRDPRNALCFMLGCHSRHLQQGAPDGR